MTIFTGKQIGSAVSGHGDLRCILNLIFEADQAGYFDRITIYLIDYLDHTIVPDPGIQKTRSSSAVGHLSLRAFGRKGSHSGKGSAQGAANVTPL
jgi:hypothetical protein